MCFSLLLGVCARAYISALRDLETRRNADKEKLIKLFVCLQALLVIVNSKISRSPATFKESQRATAITQVEERGEDWKCNQLHSLFAAERWDATRKEMKGHVALDFTVEKPLEQLKRQLV